MSDIKMNEKDKWFFKEKDHSELYNKFRPKHPSCLFQLIREKLKNFSEHDAFEKNTTHTKRALDLGCGTGSSTFPLTEFIDEVIGVDISSSQIEQAVLTYGKCKGLKFWKADVSEIEGMWCGESFDLITVGVAAHWMCLHTLFKAAQKLLKLGGLIVIYCANPQRLEDPVADDLIQNFNQEILLPLMEESVREEFLTYKGIETNMLKYFSNVQRDQSVVNKLQMTAEEIGGLMASISSYQKYVCDQKDGDEDVLETLYRKLKDLNPGKLNVIITYHFLSASKI